MILFIFIVLAVLSCMGVLIRNYGDYQKDDAARLKHWLDLRNGND